MKDFLNEDFLLASGTAQQLYHEYAAHMPVIDYHNHLPPQQIADDINFPNLTQAWLQGDHYKWRALRAHGVDESYCTGNKPDVEKFQQWAATAPYTLRNPLYHWTHLELQFYFDVYELLNEQSAGRIYQECSSRLQSREYSVRNLLRRSNVKVVCTTDDPLDTLDCHRQIKQDGFEIKVLPAFRPDKAMQVDKAEDFNVYVSRLEKVCDTDIVTYTDYIEALKSRHDFFSEMGCSVADHGMEQMYAEEYTEQEINIIFSKIRSGKEADLAERKKIKSALLHQFTVWNWEKEWVQQFHLGALRNNNSRLFRSLGSDTGFDSIGDFSQARSLSKFLDRLDSKNQLTRTIIYNLNPRDNEVMATMTGNFNDGSIKGKVQFGSGWWFLDQKDGMTRQLNALSNMGLLSHFIGMLTDSRNFLSFPRHEYFRRILCNLFGNEIEAGELPNDIRWTGKIIQDICYNNAVGYFNWHSIDLKPAQKAGV